MVKDRVVKLGFVFAIAGVLCYSGVYCLRSNVRPSSEKKNEAGVEQIEGNLAEFETPKEPVSKVAESTIQGEIAKPRIPNQEQDTTGDWPHEDLKIPVPLGGEFFMRLPGIYKEYHRLLRVAQTGRSADQICAFADIAQIAIDDLIYARQISAPSPSAGKYAVEIPDVELALKLMSKLHEDLEEFTAIISKEEMDLVSFGILLSEHRARRTLAGHNGATPPDRNRLQEEIDRISKIQFKNPVVALQRLYLLYNAKRLFDRVADHEISQKAVQFPPISLDASDRDRIAAKRIRLWFAMEDARIAYFGEVYSGNDNGQKHEEYMKELAGVKTYMESESRLSLADRLSLNLLLRQESKEQEYISRYFN